jgi:membrane protein YqaA with SNARE-associated domain
MTEMTSLKAGPLQKLYDNVIAWAAHRRAPAILSVLSFSESSFFPIPPDVMLAPMCVAQPRKGWLFALNCTISSVAGGLLGYFVGKWAFSSIEPWLMSSAYADVFHHAVQSFEQYGFWYILLAGFTPIPYKIFTISAGVVGMPLLPFVLGSATGRGGRFFLVAGLIRLLGDRAAEKLRGWVDTIGWVLLGVGLILGIGWYVLRGQG